MTPIAETDIAVATRGLVKHYADVKAVDGIDLEVRRGTCLAVLGPNGAGKTTTIEILEGLKKPDAGTVEVLGRAWDGDGRAIRERIGVQLQETDFQDKIRVVELLRMFRSFYARGADLDEIVATIGLEDKRRAFVKSLSGGQRQRLAVGCALLNEPELLFLDEPTTGLDPQARRRLWEVIERFMDGGGTVLLTTHHMEEAERLADDVIIVDRGRVIARGAPDAVIASLETESVVRFSLVGDGAGALADADLLAIDGVKSAGRDGAVVTLSVVRTQSVIASLFAVLAERGLEIEDLGIHRPTLEDVFMSLTGKHLRDE